MEYKILKHKSSFDLAEDVGKHIKLRWKPQGGVSVVFYGISGERMMRIK